MYRLSTFLALCSLWVFVGCSHYVQDYEWRRGIFAGTDVCDINSMEINPDEPLELADIVAFALTHNRDLLTQATEWFTESEAIREQYLKQLPSINTNAHWEERNNQLISSSKSVTPTPPAPPSISTNRQTKTWDITPLFSILDFGLAYFQTNQEIYKAYALFYKHQRARQNLVLDVCKAYYRALAGQRIARKAAQLLEEFDSRIETLTHQLEDDIISRFFVQQRHDRMLEAIFRYNTYESEYHVALSELTTLMGLPPGCCITLAETDELDICLPEIDMEELELAALCKRPELFQQDAQQDFDVEEVHLAILRMVPGAQLFSSYNYDGNTFLVNNHWLSIGVRASYDLLTIPSKTHGVKKTRRRLEFDHETRLSISIGVMAQVYLSRIGVADAYKQVQITQQWADVRESLSKMTAEIAKLGQFTSDDLLDRQIDALEAEIQALKAYAAMRIALEQLANSVGEPLMFEDDEVREKALISS